MAPKMVVSYRKMLNSCKNKFNKHRHSLVHSKVTKDKVQDEVIKDDVEVSSSAPSTPLTSVFDTVSNATSATSFFTSSDIQTQKSPICRLPAEVIDQISEHLSPASQVCLALSCKSLLKTINREQNLDKSNRFSATNTFCDIANRKQWSPFCTHRWALLLLLEDNRWAACADCLSLHPHKEFPTTELEKPARNRKCGMGISAGFTDLCPCYRLTPRKLLSLFIQLRTRHLSRTNNQNPLLTPTEDHTVFFHTCDHTREWWTVHVGMTFRLDESKNNIIINTRYILPGLLIHSDKLMETIPLRCCEKGSFTQRLQHLRMVGYRNRTLPKHIGNRHREACMACRYCKASMRFPKGHRWENWHGSQGLGNIDITTTKVFGRGGVRPNNKYRPHETWTKQCFHTEKTELEEHTEEFFHRQVHWKVDSPYTPGHLIDYETH